MYRYILENANDWCYFYGVNNSPEPHNIYHFPTIAEKIFPGVTNDSLKIINGDLVNSPMSFPENRIVFLSTGGSECYAQTIYQLGHELCHVYISANMVDVHLRPNMFWFEEVICEISSHLFLNQYMKDIGWNNDVNSLPYDQYSQLMFSDEYVEPFNTQNLSMAYSDEIEYFKNNSTDRKKNRYVAKLLMPIFLENPSLVSEARKLRNLYSISDFQIFLDAWEDSTNAEYKSTIQNIKECLSAQ